jgi:hypothetical protein
MRIQCKAVANKIQPIKKAVPDNPERLFNLVSFYLEAIFNA